LLGHVASNLSLCKLISAPVRRSLLGRRSSMLERLGGAAATIGGLWVLEAEAGVGLAAEELAGARVADEFAGFNDGAAA
jgi:hypothetical protein